MNPHHSCESLFYKIQRGLKWEIPLSKTIHIYFLWFHYITAFFVVNSFHSYFYNLYMLYMFNENVFLFLFQ